jgi:hypothetical protein
MPPPNRGWLGSLRKSKRRGSLLGNPRRLTQAELVGLDGPSVRTVRSSCGSILLDKIST